jgi:dolichyl-phosphate-mannose--protein O-mannosyl transferase
VLESKAPCKTGQAVKCGDLIRLEHNLTGRNLHSHAGFYSPLSNNQEVSAFGDGGDGDMGDDWEIDCNKNYSYGEISEVGDVVKGTTMFHLKHKVTA